MASCLEERIRDYLAANLGLLGDGLRLVKNEFVLPNPLGAGGRIDILARDRFGFFVVIEIKRSNQAARQALNEIHKYTALLRVQHGLSESQVRVIVVSTNWDELRVPLSECASSFPFAIEPVAITANEDGSITSVARVQLVPKSGLLNIGRVQHAFCFRKQSARDAALLKLASAVAKVGIKDYALLALDYEGDNPCVCHPHGLYLLFSSPLLGASPEEEAQVRSQIHWEEGLDQPDDNFIAALLSICERTWDDSEVGYPEKLATILSEWKVAEVSRYGRLHRNSSPLTDDDVVRLALALEGGSPIYICKLCSPRFGAAWQQLKNDVEQTLPGIAEWEVIVPILLRELQNEVPEASISVDIYNPANLFMSLYPIAAAGDFSHCPRMQIVVEEGKERLRLFVSMFTWNESTVNTLPEQFLGRVFGGVETWLTFVHFHKTHLHESEMMAAHGLAAPVVEITYTGARPPTFSRLELDGDRLLRKPFDAENSKAIGEFCAANKDYLGKLKRLLDSHAIGLTGQTLEDLERHVEEQKAKWSLGSTQGDD